jgi:hypothetical protein
MTWEVPETQREPLGFKRRWQAASHAAGVAGDAVIGEKIGRIGEDEVDGGFGKGGEDFEGVALVDAEVVLFILEDRRRRRPFATALRASGAGSDGAEIAGTASE